MTADASEAAAFGATFTPHMAVTTWRPTDGWSPVEVVALGATAMHPAAAVLHYGQSIFEGLKAFRAADGSVHVFRLADHAARMRRSSRRMAMADVPEFLFAQAVSALVARDRNLIGDAPGAALYLRPFMIAIDEKLGAGPASSYRLTVIAAHTSPARPVAETPALRVWVCDDYVRAVRGGTGNVKTAANYAASMLGQTQAIEHGCDQVVWLDGLERRWVEELGAMNIFFVHGRGSQARIVTPPLGDTVLAGVTRDSVITISGELGLPVVTEPVSIDDLARDCSDGVVTEVFATGTLAGVKRIRTVRRGQLEWTVSDADDVPVTDLLARHLYGAHQGAGRNDWCHPVDTVLSAQR